MNKKYELHLNEIQASMISRMLKEEIMQQREWKEEEIKQKCRFTIQLDHQRYCKLQNIMKALNTKQKAKAVKFLIDLYSLEEEYKEITKEK